MENALRRVRSAMKTLIPCVVRCSVSIGSIAIGKGFERRSFGIW